MSDRRGEEREVVMRVLSLFSGAGGSDLALEAAGFEVAALCEIEPHARAVLREHWPDTPLHGDIDCLVGGRRMRRRFREMYAGKIDAVVGGSPCQDLSVAGKRRGLQKGSGTRSSLFYRQVSAWGISGAPYLIWENVYGALSSNAGADFAAVLSALVGATISVPRDGWERGGVASGRTAVAAWRVLDLQHFGVPQRRERVVVLAARAGGVDPAEVLALGDSLSWDSPPRYAQREGAAAALAGSLGARSGPGGGGFGDDLDRMTFVAQEVSPTVTAKWAKGSGGPAGDEVQNLVAQSVYPSLRPNARDHSDPLYEAAMQVIQPLAHTTYAIGSHAGVADGDQTNRSHASGGPVGLGIQLEVGHSLRAGRAGLVAPIAHTLRGEGCDASEDGTGRGTPLVVAPFSERQITSKANRSDVVAGANAPSLHTGGMSVIAPCLRVGGRDQGAGDSHDNTPITAQGLGVRMLTPLECERIMGWPDDHTRYGVNGKGVRYELKDTPRYRLCGNGQAREWGEWIYLRLADAERRASEGLTDRRRVVVAA